MSELKPCPFCGDTYIRPPYLRDGSYRIGCNTVNCICLHTQGKGFASEEDAIKAWNRRVGKNGDG